MSTPKYPRYRTNKGEIERDRISLIQNNLDFMKSDNEIFFFGITFINNLVFYINTFSFTNGFEDIHNKLTCKFMNDLRTLNQDEEGPNSIIICSHKCTGSICDNYTLLKELSANILTPNPLLLFILMKYEDKVKYSILCDSVENEIIINIRDRFSSSAVKIMKDSEYII